MARRRQHEEHENHERWLVSYADFITLLFAFFVVMYSISSINEGKYKILSDTLTGVFNQPDRSIKPIPIGEERPRTTEAEQTSAEQGGPGDAQADPLQSITESMQAAFGDLISNEQMTVRGNELWVEIELNSSLLFPSAMPSPPTRRSPSSRRWRRSSPPTKTPCTSKASPITCPSAQPPILPTGSFPPPVHPVS